MGGMEDEVLEKLEGGDPRKPRVPGPRDFDGKPIWARTLVISAGVIMNMVFAFVVYTVVAGFWGFPEYATTRVGRGLPDHPARRRGGSGRGSGGVRAGSDRDEGNKGLGRCQGWPDPGHARTPHGGVPESRAVRSRSRFRGGGSPSQDGGLRSPLGRCGGRRSGPRVSCREGRASRLGTRSSRWTETPSSTGTSFLDAIRLPPGSQGGIGASHGTAGTLTRAVTLESQEEKDPVTGETRTVGQVGIYRPADEVVRSTEWASRAHWSRGTGIRLG